MAIDSSDGGHLQIDHGPAPTAPVPNAPTVIAPRAAPAPMPNAAGGTGAPTGQEQFILATAQAYVEADRNVAPGTDNFMLQQQTENFARVTVGTPAGDLFNLTLKRVNGIWVVVAFSQEMPGADVGQAFGLPAGWYSSEY